MTHVFAIAQAECPGHAAQVKCNLCHHCAAHYQSCPVPPVFSAHQEEMPPLQSGLQPVPWLSAVMSPARTSALTNTPRWELIISSCDLGGKRREGGRRERALVSLMEREGSEIRSHLRAGEEEQLFLIIRERLFLPQREGWLAGTCPRGRFYVPACVARGRGRGSSPK